MPNGEEKKPVAPALPPPVEIPEYFPGFGKELQQLGTEQYRAQLRLSKAQQNLARLQRSWGFTTPLAPPRPGELVLPITPVFGIVLQRDFEARQLEAQQEYDLALQDMKVAGWMQEVLITLPNYLSIPDYKIQSAEDVLQHIPMDDLREEDTIWLTSTYDRLKHLSNVLPEGFDGDAIEAQDKILDEILTAPKLELRAVHNLTVEEIAKSFAFGVAELPEGMTEEQVRGMLSKMDLQDEEMKSAKDWLSERAANWRGETARLNLIRAGVVLAEAPELTPVEFGKLLLTQPMMATVELLDKYFNILARPLAATAVIGVHKLFDTPEHTAAARLEENYNFYRSMGLKSWEAYATAFNEWEAPWWLKLSTEVFFDPVSYIGLGMGTAAAYKIGTGLTKVGIRKLGTRIGPWVGAFEGGYIAGADAIFKAGIAGFLAPIKGTFWLTGAGYQIPKTFTQMSRNFARDGYMKFSSALQRTFPEVRNMKGLTAKDAIDTGTNAIDQAIARPMEGWDKAVAAGTPMLEFGYIDEAVAIKLTKGIVTPVETITAFRRGAVTGRIGAGTFYSLREGVTIAARKVELNLRNILKLSDADVGAFKGLPSESLATRWFPGRSWTDEAARLGIDEGALMDRAVAEEATKRGYDAIQYGSAELQVLRDAIPSEIVFDTNRLARLNNEVLNMFSGQGERITAGKIIANLGQEATEDMVEKLSAKLVAFRQKAADTAKGALKGDTAPDVLMEMFNRLEGIRYANLQSPLTKYMNQAGRSASWHSRVADRILYSSQLVALERRLVMPIARWNLLFANFGPYNFIENMQRSFLGGAELLYPKSYSGVAETNRLLKGLANAPYELQMMERGELRLAQAMIDPKTGRTAIFKDGKVPFITKEVVIPEKVPFLGGKTIGAKINIAGRDHYLASFQDGYDMWAHFNSMQVAYDYQVHYMKALADIAPDDMLRLTEVLAKHRSALDNIAAIHPKDARDIERVLMQEATVGPESIRAHSKLDVLEFERRQISKELYKTMDKMTDVRMNTKKGIIDDVLDGSIFEDIDSKMAAFVEQERELSLISLKNQIKVLGEEADAFLANPPRNLDEFLGDMQNISSMVEGTGERIHDYRKLTELRKAKLLPGEMDDFEVGSAKLLAEFMETAEADLTRIMNQLVDNAGPAGLTDIQIARLTDLDSVSRLELENILATRNKIAEIEAVIPRTAKKARNNRFWTQQRAQKSTIWDEYDVNARKFKSLRLRTSRNFLQSVDKSVYVPDFVPEVVAELTPNHLAYLYGATGDDLYRGLTRVQHHITIRPREDFILHTVEQADAYAAKIGKASAADIGFTDDAIGEVYDQLWHNLGVEPTILTPDSPTVMQLEEIRQELTRLHGSMKIDESDVVKWRQYINSVADEVEKLPMYKAAEPSRITLRVESSAEPDVYEVIIRGKTMGSVVTEPSPEANSLLVKQLWSHEPLLIGKANLDEVMMELNRLAHRRGFEYLDIDVLGRKTYESLAKRYGFTQFEGVYPGYTGANVFRKKVVVEPTIAREGWWTSKESAMTKAREQHALAYPTYDDANIIDESMRAIFPFWNYELFRWRWIPRTWMRTPGTMTGLAKYVENTDQGYLPIPGTDLQINMLRGSVWMGGLRSFYLRDFPEYYDVMPGMEFIDYIGRAGFFPGVHVMLPIVAFGAATGKPELGQLAPAWVRTTLSGLRALSPEHIGAVLEHIFPDRFRDYMVMLTLGEEGYDADEIWRKKQSGEKLTPEEEKLWLKAANRVDGVKGILMQQTGLFRIRPQEFSEIRIEMRLAIEEATGVSVRVQEQIDRQYPVTGKRFSDYYKLDILQQKLLYEWETYRRWQGVTTPLYPSSWQLLDVKIRDYYEELEKVYNEARTVGVYEDGKLIRPSMVEMNRQWVEGEIGPDQWMSFRSDLVGSLAEATRVLGESPAYKDVPKTFEERAKMLEERGIPTPTQTPDQELLYYYYELSPEYKWNWESQRMERDFNTYYAYIDILLETLDAPHRERLLQRIQSDWTPMEKLYWQISREHMRPYRNLRDIVLREYEPEQIQQIRRFEVASVAEREEIREIIGPEGDKLIASYQRRLREARQRLRILDPEMDAWLNFFGTTTSLISTESKIIYEELRKRYLVDSMIQ